MPTAVGPNTFGEENLVFGYDLGDVSNSYKGEPTTNLISNAATFNFNGSYQNGNDGTFITEFGTTGYQMINRGSWNGIYQNFNLVNSGTYTFSAWFKYLGGAATPNGGTVYISNYGSGDVSAGVNKNLIGQWQRVTKTVSVTSPTNVYFYIISYGGTNGGDNHSWQVTMPQIELNSHATPFVGGTRSATQGLLDLTGNSTIDLTNVSFDSNAQMTFDGTDDRISIPAGALPTIGTSDFTLEFVCKNTKTSSYNHFFSVNNQYHFAFKASNTTGILYVYRDSSLSTTSSIPAYISSRTSYYHITAKREGDNIEIFVNGVSQGTKSGWGNVSIDNNSYTSYIGWGNASEYTGGDIPVAKIYNRALSAEEIKSNFNAIKGRFNI